MLAEDTKKKKEITKKLEEVQHNERTNQFGIMDGSTVTITVIEARELNAKSSYVQLMNVNVNAEPQKQLTEPINSVDPVWNEVTSFDVTDGREHIKAQVFAPSQIGADRLLGECIITLEELWDQYKHDEWFEL